MCEPVTIALLVASTVATVAGGVVAAKGQREAGKYNQAVAKVNATAADQQAVQTEQLGEQQAAEAHLRTRLAIGSQRVALAANNVDLQSGTPADIQSDTAMFGQIDESRIRANAARQAWGLRTQGLNYRAQGTLDRYQGNVGSFSTLLGTAGQAFGTYAGATRKGPGG